jgi:hypothetical protein
MSTAKLMAQQLNFKPKNSVFSVPIIVTTSLLFTMSYVIF